MPGESNLGEANIERSTVLHLINKWESKKNNNCATPKGRRGAVGLPTEGREKKKALRSHYPPPCYAVLPLDKWESKKMPAMVISKNKPALCEQRWWLGENEEKEWGRFERGDCSVAACE